MITIATPRPPTCVPKGYQHGHAYQQIQGKGTTHFPVGIPEPSPELRHVQTLDIRVPILIGETEVEVFQHMNQL